MRAVTGLRAFGLAAGVLVLGACSTMEKLDPTTWFDEPPPTTVTSTAKPKPGAEGVPGEGQSFPNLGSIPNQAPKTQTTAEERKKIADALIADTRDVQYADKVVRPEQAAVAPPAPRPQKAEPAAQKPSDAAKATPASAPAASVKVTPPAPSTPPSAASAPSGAAGSVPTAPPSPEAVPSPIPPAPVASASPVAPAPAPKQVASAAPPPAASPPAPAPAPPSPPPAAVAPSPPPSAPPPQMAAIPPAPAPAAPADGSAPAVMAAPSPTPIPSIPAPPPPAPVPLPPVAAASPAAAPSAPAPSALPELLPAPSPFPSGPGAPTTTIESPSAPMLTPPRGRAAGAASATKGVRSLAQFDRSKVAISAEVATISFAEGGSDLRAADLAILRDLAGEHRARGGSVRVVGYARGAASTDRAQAVARALVERGVPASKIYAGEMAESDPAYAAGRSEAAPSNRRVDIYFDY